MTNYQNSYDRFQNVMAQIKTTKPPMPLAGKKVQLNMDALTKRNNSEKFIKYIKANKDSVFTAYPSKDKTTSNLYSLVGGVTVDTQTDNLWVFHESVLTVVEGDNDDE